MEKSNLRTYGRGRSGAGRGGGKKGGGPAAKMSCDAATRGVEVGEVGEVKRQMR